MLVPSIFFGDTAIELVPAPIRAEWILEGTPVARNREISQGRTRNSTTFVWDCTAGTFNWHYDTDEIVHVLEGSVLLSQDGGPPRLVQAGEVVFFPAGSSARWEVETYIRKLAFFSRKMPKPVEIGLDALRRLKARVLPRANLASAPSAMPG